MRRLVVGALVAMTFVVAASAASATVHRHRAPNLVILVVAGQSNAVGYQSFVIDPKTHKDIFTDGSRSAADGKVLLTFQESGVTGGALPPGRLDTPQRRTGATSPIFGPEVGLARYLYGAGHRNLFVVKVAFSGSSLAANWTSHNVDYESLIARVHEAETWALDNGWSPTIGAFYWMQGESDAINATYAADYRTNLLQFMANVRHSLTLKQTVPFVIGQIDLTQYIKYEQANKLCTSPTCTSEKLWNSEVMKAQASVAGRYVFVAKTSKLPRYEDFLHLTDAAELTLGTAFGRLSRSHL
jgi:hypothetical protein